MALTIVKEEPAALTIVGEEPVRSAAADLNETLNFAGFDTGIKINPELSAYLTAMGGGMSGSYRGAKQLLGLDDGQEAENQTGLRRLEADPEVGGYAAAGGVIGTGFDPITLALPISKGKSLLDMAKYGAAGGAAAGALAPVAPGDSRAINTVTGAVAGGTLSPVIGAIATRGRMPLRAPVELPQPRIEQLRLGYQPDPIIVNSAGEAGTEAQMFARKYAPQAGDVVVADSAYDVGSRGIGLATGQEAIKDAILARRAASAAPDLTDPAIPIQEVLRRRQAGNINPQLAAQMGSASLGAATGALTADEDASPAEIASRALIGGAGGWGLGKLGGRLVTTRPGAVHPPIAAATRAAEPVAVIGDMVEPLFKTEVAPGTTKQIASVAKAFFEANPGLRDPSRLISDDIQRYVAGGAVPEEMLAAHNLTPQIFADVWRSSISDHARSLGYLSQVMREAQANMTPEELAALRAAGGAAEDGAYIRPFWKKLTDTWRGLLVTQPATAVRNAITQAGRVGLDVIQAPIDSWIQAITGRPQTVHPLDGFNEMLSLFQRNKSKTDKILSAFPQQRERLFQQYISEVERSARDGPVWGAIQTGVDAANILNRSQEFIIRRGIFQSSLDVELRNRGKDLAQIIQTNAIGQIPDDAVKAAVSASLSKTFGESPAYGTLARKWIDVINSTPGANIAIPFPRFMANAIKFQYEYSPLGVLSYLSSAERAAFAAGKVDKVSKAIIGSGMLGGAMLFRNSEFAGEKWYEAVNADGEVLDLRPFNPFSSYLFVADVTKKWSAGTLHKLSGSDVAQGLLSTNMRAGTGLYLLDNALNMLSKSADETKLLGKAGELTGDFLAGFLTPLTPFRDAYDQMTKGETSIKDTRQGFLGPLKNRIPGVSQTLPDAEMPTRTGPSIYIDPLLRQVTGVSKKDPKNPLEKELDRLGFERRDVLTGSGDRELDSQYAKAMGVVSEQFLVPIVESDGYKRLSDTVKGVVLSEVIEEVRHEVKQIINDDLPDDKKMKLELRKQPPRLRLLLKEFGITDQQ